MNERLSGDAIQAIRAQLRMSEIDFALLFGVTVRTVQLWESDVVVPSVLTSMVIRAEVAKRMHVAAAQGSARGETSRSQRQVAAPRPPATRRPRQRA